MALGQEAVDDSAVYDLEHDAACGDLAIVDGNAGHSAIGHALHRLDLKPIRRDFAVLCTRGRSALCRRNHTELWCAARVWPELSWPADQLQRHPGRDQSE